MDEDVRDPGRAERSAPITLSPHLLALGREVVSAVLGKYRKNLDETQETLRRAAADGDLAAIENAAHSLKGSSGTVGAMPMAEICRRLEDAARQGAVEVVGGALGELDREAVALRPALDAQLAAVTGGGSEADRAEQSPTEDG